MGKLRFEQYQAFAKRIEYPVVSWEAKTGKICFMNYEAKLILGQIDEIKVSLDEEISADSFWENVHHRKTVVVRNLIFTTERKSILVGGLLNEYELDGQCMYMCLFDIRTQGGMNSWMLEQIIDHSNLVVAYLSFDEHIKEQVKYISKNVRQYGYTSEQFYSGAANFRDLIHPDDMDILGNYFSQCIRDKSSTANAVYRIVTESREIRTMRAMIFMQYKENGILSSAEMIWWDITEEMREKNENQYLRNALERSRNVILVKQVYEDVPHIKYLSSNAIELGFDVEDMRSGKKRFEDYIFQDDREQVSADLYVYSTDRPVTRENEARFLGEDGQIRWLNYQICYVPMEEKLYEIEITLRDTTRIHMREEDLRNSKKELEQKLEYIMQGQLDVQDLDVYEVLDFRMLQDFLAGYAINNDLYVVMANLDGKAVTKPMGPMARMGEFYDLLEQPKYKKLISETQESFYELNQYMIVQVEEGDFDRLFGMVPVHFGERLVGSCLIYAYDEGAISRMHRTIENLHKMMETIVGAAYDHYYLENDSRRSRLAEKNMSEELKGQAMLARAFANMRTDANATIEEIIRRACKLLELTSIAVYCGDVNQESYVLQAAYVDKDGKFKDYPDHSWRLAEISRKDDIISKGGFIVAHKGENMPQMEYLLERSQTESMILYGIMVQGINCGTITFARDQYIEFTDRTIAFCKDVVDAIAGIIIRSRAKSNVMLVNRELLKAYNYVSDYVFVKEIQSGRILFANEAMESLFGMDVTGIDSHSFLPEPTPIYTREGRQAIGDIKWQSYIHQVGKIMNIQELVMEWENDSKVKMVIMREKV